MCAVIVADTRRRQAQTAQEHQGTSERKAKGRAKGNSEQKAGPLDASAQPDAIHHLFQMPAALICRAITSFEFFPLSQVQKCTATTSRSCATCAGQRLRGQCSCGPCRSITLWDAPFKNGLGVVFQQYSCRRHVPPFYHPCSEEQGPLRNSVGLHGPRPHEEEAVRRGTLVALRAAAIARVLRRTPHCMFGGHGTPAQRHGMVNLLALDEWHKISKNCRVARSTPAQCMYNARHSRATEFISSIGLESFGGCTHQQQRLLVESFWRKKSHVPPRSSDSVSFPPALTEIPAGSLARGGTHISSWCGRKHLWTRCEKRHRCKLKSTWQCRCELRPGAQTKRAEDGRAV